MYNFNQSWYAVYAFARLNNECKKKGGDGLFKTHQSTIRKKQTKTKQHCPSKKWLVLRNRWLMLLRDLGNVTENTRRLILSELSNQSTAVHAFVLIKLHSELLHSGSRQEESQGWCHDGP